MDNVQPLRPRGRGSEPRSPRGGLTRRWRVWLLFGLLPLLLVAMSLLRLWVDLLWFEELGHREVLITRLQWGGLMGLISGLVAFAVVHLNLTISRRVAKNDLYVPFLEAGVAADAPEQPTVPHFVMKPILLGGSVLIGLFAGLAMSGQWETVLRWLGRSDFGIADPLYDRDVSFYVFTMPLLELVVRATQVLVIVTALAVIVSYVATGVIRYTPVPRIARAAVAHLAGLVAAFFVIESAQYMLQSWNLVLSTRGALNATGAGFTDMYARRPGFWALAVASLVIAVIVAYYARRARWRIVGGAIVGWFALAVLVSGIIPSVVQSVLVRPNELNREEKLLRGNIDMTRKAWGMDEVETRDFKDEAKLDQADFDANRATTDNIRLWSPGVLQRALTQIQNFRSYYEFRDVDVDRYTVNGQYRQVMLAPRELSATALPSDTWTSQRLVYTHGYGVVAAWPNESERGRPSMLLRDLPPKPVGQKDIVVERPAIYYGEEDERQVIANSEVKEFDYPSGGDDDVQVSYDGSGGIPVSSFARRVALAATFGDAQLLWSTQVNSESRFMFRRNIRERVTELAPFLGLDDDPYPVILDGRLLWVLDGYTTTDRFPYSQFSGAEPSNLAGNNYVRNSVKVTVDAYDGEVHLYVVDEQDPILGAWRDIFPKLFSDRADMPEGLEAHLRYPEDLFNAQTDKWRSYHVSDVRRFYGREDLWEVPILDRQPQEAFYLLARLPEQKQAEMLLVRPLTPTGRKNMIAYMVARMDPGHYGEVISTTLPKDSLTQGPQQVQALIRQDEDIREQLTLWERGETKPVFGDLLVLPLGSSLIYVQPIYLESDEAQLPELERVVVALGDTIAWGDTFEDAVQELLRERAAVTGGEEPAKTSDGQTGGDAGSGSAPPASTGSIDGLSEAELKRVLGEVSERYERAQECQRDGDWACYGRETDAIRTLLEQAGSGEAPQSDER